MADVIRYTREIGTPLTEEEINMIRSARNFEDEYDKDNPPIDAETTPALYVAMMEAVAERNRRVSAKLRGLA